MISRAKHIAYSVVNNDINRIIYGKIYILLI